jgi:ABC-type branched-subunit amino acid transport system permease subunit
MLLPVGRSGWAIVAGYMGMLSILGVFAPIAVISGIIAIKQINKSAHTPNPKYGLGRAYFGLILGGLFCALYGFVIVQALLRTQ